MGYLDFKKMAPTATGTLGGHICFVEVLQSRRVADVGRWNSALLGYILHYQMAICVICELGVTKANIQFSGVFEVGVAPLQSPCTGLMGRHILSFCNCLSTCE